MRRNRSGKEGEGPADSAKEESHRLFCRCPGPNKASILEESLERGIGTGTVYQGWEIDIVLRSWAQLSKLEAGLLLSPANSIAKPTLLCHGADCFSKSLSMTTASGSD